jgi:hypothetical protein
MTRRTKFFAGLAAGAFVAILALSALGAWLDARGWHGDPELAKRLGYAAGSVFFALFLLLGFSLVPLMIRAFVVLQTRIGNGELAPIQALRAHERGVAYAIWALFGSGLAIATPVMLHDMFGMQFQLPVGKSAGVLVANVGMTLDEVRQRSSIPVLEGTLSELTGDRTVIGSPVFDFEIAGSPIRFARCRYYWMQTGGHGDPHIESINIGVSTQKLTRAELVEAHRSAQTQLVQDGWEAGHYNYKTPEQQALHGGITSSGRGYFWRKGGTLLRLVGKRMDDEAPGEDPETAGEWIQTVELGPANDSTYSNLEFSPAE